MNKTIMNLFFGLFFFSCSEEGITIERQFLPLKINETSGLEYYNDNFLTHNDSGGETILYEFNKEGKIVDEHFIENCGENNDWEDITADSKNIYIANSGNNYGTRQNLAVLILDKEMILSARVRYNLSIRIKLILKTEIGIHTTQRE